MKIITCASYGASGSSALTDLVAEYSNVQRMTDAEFRFLHDPDGISDLEFQLVECHNRHNAGRALKRFWRQSQFNGGNRIHRRYERFFDGKYLELSKQYVDDLMDFTSKGWWDYDLLDKGDKRDSYMYRKKIEDRILKAIPFINKRVLDNEIMFFSHPSEEQFLNATRKYVHALLEAANLEGKEYIEVDQIVGSQNIDRYLRYFSDPIEVFVVDRDPRDIYVLEKVYYPIHYGSYNNDSVEVFCKKFKYIRESGNPEQSTSEHIHYLQFENFLFDYVRIVNEVEEVTGLKAEDHTKKFQFLNPMKSVNNVQTWIEQPGLADDIQYIENALGNYLYPFEEYSRQDVKGIPIDDKTKF